MPRAETMPDGGEGQLEKYLDQPITPFQGSSWKPGEILLNICNGTSCRLRFLLSSNGIEVQSCY